MAWNIKHWSIGSMLSHKWCSGHWDERAYFVKSRHLFGGWHFNDDAADMAGWYVSHSNLTLFTLWIAFDWNQCKQKYMSMKTFIVAVVVVVFDDAAAIAAVSVYTNTIHSFSSEWLSRKFNIAHSTHSNHIDESDLLTYSKLFTN